MHRRGTYQLVVLLMQCNWTWTSTRVGIMYMYRIWQQLCKILSVFFGQWRIDQELTSIERSPVKKFHKRTGPIRQPKINHLVSIKLNNHTTHLHTYIIHIIPNQHKWYWKKTSSGLWTLYSVFSTLTTKPHLFLGKRCQTRVSFLFICIFFCRWMVGTVGTGTAGTRTRVWVRICRLCLRQGQICRWTWIAFTIRTGLRTTILHGSTRSTTILSRSNIHCSMVMEHLCKALLDPHPHLQKEQES